MDLFCFASKNLENIRLGVEHRMWAVATKSDTVMKGRVTKANKYLHVGSRGLFYCSPTQSFCVPFIVLSKADPHKVITDIWPEPWVLPFKINPLGDHTRTMSSHDAERRWPIFGKRAAEVGNMPGAMNITGVTVFVPVEITDDDWNIILSDLARGAKK